MLSFPRVWEIPHGTANMSHNLVRALIAARIAEGFVAIHEVTHPSERVLMWRQYRPQQVNEVDSAPIDVNVQYVVFLENSHRIRTEIYMEPFSFASDPHSSQEPLPDSSVTFARLVSAITTVDRALIETVHTYDEVATHLEQLQNLSASSRIRLFQTYPVPQVPLGPSLSYSTEILPPEMPSFSLGRLLRLSAYMIQNYPSLISSPSEDGPTSIDNAIGVRLRESVNRHADATLPISSAMWHDLIAPSTLGVDASTETNVSPFRLDDETLRRSVCAVKSLSSGEILIALTLPAHVRLNSVAVQDSNLYNLHSTNIHLFGCSREDLFYPPLESAAVREFFGDAATGTCLVRV